GMGRNGISSEYRTWDLATGESVEPWKWVGATPSEYGEVELPAKLAHFGRREDEGADCESYRGKGQWILGLQKDGINFREDAYGEGECELDFVVSYAQLEAYLTPEGKQAVAR